jgi:hypothetical protein
MKKKLVLSGRDLFISFMDFMYQDHLDDKKLEKFLEIAENWDKFQETPENLELIKVILYPPFAEHIEEIKEVKSIVQNLTLHSDFFTKDDCLYHVDVPNLSIPKSLAKRFNNIFQNPEEVETELPRLINFWKWLSLNPDAESREDVYAWIGKYNIPILPSGLMLTFRRVVKMGTIAKEAYAIFEAAQEWFIKQKRNKKSVNVMLYKHYDNTYSLKPTKDDQNGAEVGLLPQLVEKGTSEGGVHYTDNHSKTYKYYLGKENRMNRSEVDPDKNRTCSKGFHVAGPKFAYSGFGDTPVACIVNPKDILVVYTDDHGKTRCSAFTIVGILKEDAEWKDDKDILETIDVAAQYQVDELNRLIKESNIRDVKVQNFLKEGPGVNFNTLPTFFELKNFLPNS